MIRRYCDMCDQAMVGKRNMVCAPYRPAQWKRSRNFKILAEVVSCEDDRVSDLCKPCFMSILTEPGWESNL